jgi:oligopeptide transport system ATP-binding protein
MDLPKGCPFHPRCPVAEARCAAEKPPLIEDPPGRSVVCHFPARAADVLGRGLSARAAPAPR